MSQREAEEARARQKTPGVPPDSTEPLTILSVQRPSGLFEALPWKRSVPGTREKGVLESKAPEHLTQAVADRLSTVPVM